MEADVILNGNTVQLKGNVDVIASERELDVNGPLAGYAFHDRSTPSKRYVLYADRGKAFLWQDGIGNILSVAAGSVSAEKMSAQSIIAEKSLIATSVSAGDVTSASVSANQLIVKGSGPTGTILVKWDESIPIIITKDGKPAPARVVVREMDLVKMIQELQATIQHLESRLRTAETKLGIVTPIVIKH